MGTGHDLTANHIESHAGLAPPAPSWQPPTDVEQGLYDAKTRGDWAAYFDVLAAADLYHAASRAALDAQPGWVEYTPRRLGPRPGPRYIVCLTGGMLPAPVPDPVFFTTDLGRLAEHCRDDEWLAINPGTPCEAFFPATAADRRMWRHHVERTPYPYRNVLRTLRVGGPLRGPVAHGLACGALLCVSNGSLWNAMGWHGTGYVRERTRLREWWGITSREEWRAAQESLLTGETNRVWSFVLGVRGSLARSFGGAVDADHWRHAVSRILREGAGEGAEATGTRDAEVEGQIAGAQRLIGRIMRYESRFRADGLLAEGRFVHSVEAWDYGRASKMARWGLGARYCSLEEAEQAVIRAGRLSRVSYRSWADFSAAYVLGRCLHFDDEEFGTWYEEMLNAHRILMTDPASPWLNIPFKTG